MNSVEFSASIFRVLSLSLLGWLFSRRGLILLVVEGDIFIVPNVSGAGMFINRLSFDGRFSTTKVQPN